MTNKQNKALLLCAILAVPVLSLAGIILRALALFTDFNHLQGDYFLSRTSFSGAYLILSLASILVLLLLAILLRKKFSFSSAKERAELPTLFSSAFLSITLAATAVVSIFAASAPELDTLIRYFYIAIAILSFATLGYLSFFLRGIAPSHSLPRTYLALCPSLLALILAILFYFDHTIQINAPAKLLVLAAFVAFAFVFLVECRFYFSSPKPAIRYLTLGIGFYLAITASLPNLIYTMVTGEALVLHVVYDFLLFAFALYALSALLALLPDRERKVPRMLNDVLSEEGAQDAPTEEEAESESPASEEALEEEPVAEQSAPEAAEAAAETTPAPKKTTKKKTEKAE